MSVDCNIDRVYDSLESLNFLMKRIQKAKKCTGNVHNFVGVFEGVYVDARLWDIFLNDFIILLNLDDRDPEFSECAKSFLRVFREVHISHIGL
jgi:hypothetical protein